MIARQSRNHDSLVRVFSIALGQIQLRLASDLHNRTLQGVFLATSFERYWLKSLAACDSIMLCGGVTEAISGRSNGHVASHVSLRAPSRVFSYWSSADFHARYIVIPGTSSSSHGEWKVPGVDCTGANPRWQRHSTRGLDGLLAILQDSVPPGFVIKVSSVCPPSQTGLSCTGTNFPKAA
ncbi:MAG: hypothetical protein RIS70_1150 [Planctomycetota bacterium]|jgi:hypothetical protein